TSFAKRHNKTVTFMPKPLFADNGSGMHTHISLWKDGKPLFAGNGYSGLSEMALFFIGGILKDAPALTCFPNPHTNRFKRLVPVLPPGAIEALQADHSFLLRGDVFNEDFIANWVDMKQKEYDALRLRPHPYEFAMYYDV